MSHAESATPVHQEIPAQGQPAVTPDGPGLLAANHLRDTLLPVRPALVDRGSAERMKAGMVEELLAAPDTVAVVLAGRQGLVSGGSLHLANARELHTELAAAGTVPDLVVYLGAALPAADLPTGTELLLFVLPAAVEPGTAGVPEEASWAGFRDVAAGLGPTATALFVEASAIANWHAGHTHCPRCGTPTEVQAGGWVRRCPADSSEHYPRTDPAIIVTVVGPDGRLLLGGGGPADAKNFSTLAGFVEPGESLEQAVVRELFEEVGVRVKACQYLGSQSWPFPASLMLGFTAITDDAVATPDGVEVTRARWFSREELQDAVLSGEITISSRLSIARALIEHWYGGRIRDLADA
ncbi:NUDIX hydrolase [Pseudarthrobacter chlorophenolicus A6]|uniref:NAD(+) diphosphatase n=1 Tax=Pseudarthrobacter chlorophenolicus (strain ATCC 700700 / DSM 12829 / CIP 107037 / JCM 12360 / KCTC 9906 / NCIMB 13794 / A6) TaxID=452863 RepID=B8HBQ3_PSECP|nr:NAD(+) diphosphatase [Pseudarthrobacter chlorophenolicus]ACL40441.1 NUDIX hydrolase [Pseudarthrobacter chlorophenolicus A6]SDQ81492.1 NAD+ diphosphatase [Pseudarthrobacter chlorophenolicus]